MSGKAIRNIAASVRNRLLNLARGAGKPYNEILIQYALERFLFRLSKSPFNHEFLLKGGLLLMARGLPQARPTRDIDLLGLSANEPDAIPRIFQTIGESAFQDGVIFDFTQMSYETLTAESEYPGIRLRFQGRIGSATVPMQIDIGFGDIVVPDPTEITFPTLLETEPPVILGYAPETVIAEKFEAALDLAYLNSRMKDYYDIWFLSKTRAFVGQILQEATVSTCRRRKTEVRSDAEMFRDEFMVKPDKQSQWMAFLRKSALSEVPENFSEIMNDLRLFLQPLADACDENLIFQAEWPPGGPWKQ